MDVLLSKVAAAVGPEQSILNQTVVALDEVRRQLGCKTAGTNTEGNLKLVGWVVSVRRHRRCRALGLDLLGPIPSKNEPSLGENRFEVPPDTAFTRGKSLAAAGLRGPDIKRETAAHRDLRVLCVLQRHLGRSHRGLPR